MVELLRSEPHFLSERGGVVDDGAPLGSYAAHEHEPFDVVDYEQNLL